MLIKKNVGITSYGVSLPKWKILTQVIADAQGKNASVGKSLAVVSKTVPRFDEDTITLATQASANALINLKTEKKNIGALFVGSESHPYAVKPSGTVIKSALGLSEEMAMADLQFACKAATQGLQIGISYVLSELAEEVLVVGSDTAQSSPGDALEYTAGAGAAAYVLGSERVLAKFLATTSVATDTPDFWRRPGESYPQHAGRFSGGPAYFYHIGLAANKILEETRLTPKDFQYCVFHTPNGKFPREVVKQLGFSESQLAPSLLVENIGNTYAAAVPLALSAVLDIASANEKILVVSYGSGSGSDAFVLETTQLLAEFNKNRLNKVEEQISELEEVDYQTYLTSMKLLAH
jgi:hydroxymethylglutaryl-CoA synthase